MNIFVDDEMRIAVISDIHANSVALAAVLEDISKFKVDKIVCLGDIVGYGPSPTEALKLVRENCDIVIAGNHDDAVCGRTDDSEFIDLAGEAITRHKTELSKSDISYLRKLKYTAAFEGALFAHGDIADPKKFYYVEDIGDAEANFKTKCFSLLFVGHTHNPAIFYVKKDGEAHQSKIVNLKLEEGCRYIINPGSVGYPREADGKCCSSYLIYDTSVKAIYFRFIPFSVASVLQRGPGIVKDAKRFNKPIMLIGILSFLALSTIAVFLLSAKETVEKPPQNDPPPIAEVNTKPVRRCEVLIDRTKTVVVANLKLAPSSPPAELRVSFRLANGEMELNNSFTVKKSSTKKIKIPRKQDCDAAVFEIYPVGDDKSDPVIEKFQPVAK